MKTLELIGSLQWSSSVFIDMANEFAECYTLDDAIGILQQIEAESKL